MSEYNDQLLRINQSYSRDNRRTIVISSYLAVASLTLLSSSLIPSSDDPSLGLYYLGKGLACASALNITLGLVANALVRKNKVSTLEQRV
jgi:hypothetical protein